MKKKKGNGFNSATTWRKKKGEFAVRNADPLNGCPSRKKKEKRNGGGFNS